MKRFLLLILSTALLCTAYTPRDNSKIKGHLVIIGGGFRSDEIMERFFEWGGGKDKPYVVICTASPKPEEMKVKFTEEFHSRGVANVVAIAPTRAQSNDENYLKVFDGVQGVFFCGGSQTSIADTLRGTALHERLWKIYREGGVIAGTSAGAGMMSDPMLARNNIEGKNVPVEDIRADFVYVRSGMGFLPGATLDQHFLKRSRENRAFSVALQYPDKPVIGIDEGTALMVSNGRDIEVCGMSAVMVMEVNPKTVRRNEKGLLGTSGMTVRILLPGDRYRLKL